MNNQSEMRNPKSQIVRVLPIQDKPEDAHLTDEIVEEIKGGRGTKYDAAVVDVIQQIIENGEFEI